MSEYVMVPRVLTKEMEDAGYPAETSAEGWAAMLAAAPTPPAGEPVEIECRHCYNCNHAGINDESDTQGACFNCDWQGPAQAEDLCPECGKEGTMTAACPECGHRYTLIAHKSICAPQPAAAAPREPAPAVGGDNWIDVSERKPSEAQEVLFVLDGKTVAGAWIGEIFWYSNKPRAALWWQPFPKPRLSAETKAPPSPPVGDDLAEQFRLGYEAGQRAKAPPVDELQRDAGRAAFEAWAANILGDNPTWKESAPAELAWQSWQAAIQARRQQGENGNG